MPSQTPHPQNSGQPSHGADPSTPITVLTEADSGRFITLEVGSEAALRLSHNYVWDEPTLEGAGVELTPVDYLVDPGFTEWLISATGPGVAAVVTNGAPACADATACPPTTVHIEVRVR